MPPIILRNVAPNLFKQTFCSLQNTCGVKAAYLEHTLCVDGVSASCTADPNCNGWSHNAADIYINFVDHLMSAITAASAALLYLYICQYGTEFVTSVKEVMFSSAFVCLFVSRLCAKTTQPTFTKYDKKIWHMG